MQRQTITVDEAAADPTNVYEVRVSGDTAIASVKIHGDGRNAWLYIAYASGGSASGIPAHWPAFVRYVEDDPTPAPFAVGDVVTFRTDPGTGSRITLVGTVSRVWENKQYVSIHRDGTNSLYVRLLHEVHAVTAMHRPGIEDEAVGAGQIRARAVCRDCGNGEHVPVSDWYDTMLEARNAMWAHETATRPTDTKGK